MNFSSDKKIDKNIWEKFIKGDKNAFSFLYRESINDLYSFGMSITFNPELVKDAIQEVFIVLYEKRENLKLSGNLDIYLFKSLRNKIIEQIRTDKRKQEVDNELSIKNQKVYLSEVSFDFDISEERQNRIKAITKSINSLSIRQKEAIYLKYTEGLNYEEISEVLEIDIASARTLVYRGIKKIKKIIFHSTIILFLLTKVIHKPN
ncbi:MAG: RNA polymerase sigma factor [Draconibacterium sp.]|nr:RNA polymerase sigma factor [Draconibacterium sp.]